MAQRGMIIDCEESRKLPRVAQVSEMRHARLGDCRPRSIFPTRPMGPQGLFSQAFLGHRIQNGSVVRK
jgi:hypothetical protein